MFSGASKQCINTTGSSWLCRVVAIFIAIEVLFCFQRLPTLVFLLSVYSVLHSLTLSPCITNKKITGFRQNSLRGVAKIGEMCTEMALKDFLFLTTISAWSPKELWGHLKTRYSLQN